MGQSKYLRICVASHQIDLQWMSKVKGKKEAEAKKRVGETGRNCNITKECILSDFTSYVFSACHTESNQ